MMLPPNQGNHFFSVIDFSISHLNLKSTTILAYCMFGN